MGQPHSKKMKEDFIQSEKDYTQFLSLYSYFLHSFIKNCFPNNLQEEIKMESQLQLAISLMTSIDTHLTLRNSLLNHFFYYPNNRQRQDTERLINDLKANLQFDYHYSCIFQQRTNLFDDCFNYHYQHSIKGIIDDYPSPVNIFN